MAEEEILVIETTEDIINYADYLRMNNDVDDALNISNVQLVLEYNIAVNKYMPLGEITYYINSLENRNDGNSYYVFKVHSTVKVLDPKSIDKKELKNHNIGFREVAVVV